MAITIKAHFDGSEVKKGFEELAADAGKASEAVAQQATEAAAASDKQLDKIVELNQEMRDLAVSEKAHREATEAAARAADDEARAQKKAADAAKQRQKEETDAAKQREQAERSAEQAAQQAETSRQVAMLRAGQAAKEFSEGVGDFAKVYAETNDIAAAFGAVEGKAVAAMSVINPLAGAVTAAAIAGVKLWQNFNGAKEAAEKAEEATARWKKEAQQANEAFAAGVGEASRMAASFNDVFSVGDATAKLQMDLDRIAETRKIIADQVSRVPEAVAMELMEQKGLLRVEELKLQAMMAVLKNRGEQLASTKTLADFDRAALAEAEKAIKKIREENEDSIVTRMEKEKERAKEVKESAEDQAELDKKFEEDLQKLIDETTKKVRDNFKAYNKDNDERKKLLETLKQAEAKLNEQRDQNHQRELARIAERTQKEIESRQRIVDAEVAMQQGINRAADEAEKKKNAPFMGPAGDIAAGANAAKNDERKVFEGFVKQRVKEAEEKAKADIDQAQAKAEEEARASGADEEGVKEFGREARRKAQAANRGAGAKARTEASKDWRDYQAGKGTEEEREETGREVDAAREREADAYIQQRKKEFEREAKRSGGGISPQERAAIDNVFSIVQQVMHQAALQNGDLSGLQEQVRALQAMLDALTKQGEDRRRRNGGRA